MPSPFLLLFGLPGTTYFFLDSVFALNASFRSLICTLGRKLTGAKLLLYFFFCLPLSFLLSSRFWVFNHVVLPTKSSNHFPPPECTSTFYIRDSSFPGTLRLLTR